VEIYAVPQEPPSDGAVRALDQRALGLVFVMAALMSLPQTLSTFAQMLLIGDMQLPFGVWSMLLAAVVFGVVQLLVGFAVAWQWSSRRLWFAGLVACGLITIVAAWNVMSEELGVRTIIVALLETVGTPLLVVAAPYWFRLRRVTEAHALGGLLLVSGLSTAIGQPIMMFDQARMLTSMHAPPGTWLGGGVEHALTITIAIASLVAGWKLARHRPARRAVLAYVIISIGVHVLLTGAKLIFLGPYEDHGIKAVVITSTLIYLPLSLIRPVAVWLYAKRELDSSTASVDAALPWIALWFVPPLIARCLLWEEFSIYAGDTLGFVLLAICLALGIVLLLAARDSLRDPGVWSPWLVVGAFAAALVTVVVYLGHKSENTYSHYADAAVAPVTLIFATALTAAWLRRRVTSAG